MKERMRNAIKEALSNNKSNFAIYPFGMQGKLFKEILNREFGITETFLIDNASMEDSVKKFSDIPGEILKECTIFMVSDNLKYYSELRIELLKFCDVRQVIDVLENGRLSIHNYRDIITKKQRVIFNPIMRYGIEKELKDLQYVGRNSGNLVFSEAFKENVEYDIETKLTDDWTRDLLGKNNIYAIMPASNFISDFSTWIADLVPILEKTDVHFTLAGLGAQASFEETPKDVVSKLSSGQLRFFKLVSERSNTIGVRGEFSAECLEEMGIKNVDIIGCPSFFQYKDEYPVLQDCSSKKILYTADCRHRKIYDLVKNYDAHRISQNLKDGDENIIFYDFQEWNQYISENKFTFAFGSRFHGNMMALRNKVPTLWIVHDWRTLELVQYLGLPYLNYNDEKFQNVKNVEELFEYCDYSNVYKCYSTKYQHFQKFIKQNFGE